MMNSKRHEWKIDARALMDGSLAVPPEAKIWKQFGACENVRERLQAEHPDVAMRAFNCPGGWVIVNEWYEVVGGQRGKRRKIWYALIPRAR